MEVALNSKIAKGPNDLIYLRNKREAGMFRGEAWDFSCASENYFSKIEKKTTHYRKRVGSDSERLPSRPPPTPRHFLISRQEKTL